MGQIGLARGLELKPELVRARRDRFGRRDGVQLATDEVVDVVQVSVLEVERVAARGGPLAQLDAVGPARGDISTLAVMECGRLSTCGLAKYGIDCVLGR